LDNFKLIIGLTDVKMRALGSLPYAVNTRQGQL